MMRRNLMDVSLADNAMTDESLGACLEDNMDLLPLLGKIIPVLGHRLSFVKAFKAQKVNAGGAARQVRLILP